MLVFVYKSGNLKISPPHLKDNTASISMKRTASGSFSHPRGSINLDNSLIVREIMDLSTVTNTTKSIKQITKNSPMPNSSNWNTYTYPIPIEIDGEHVTVQNPTSLTGTPYCSPVNVNRRKAKSFDDIRLPPILPRYTPYPVLSCGLREISRHCHSSPQFRPREKTNFPMDIDSKVVMSTHSTRSPPANQRMFKALESTKYDEINHSDVTPPLSPDPTCMRTAVHSNQPYLREHLHCVRYLKEDLHLPWGVVHYQFHQIFRSKPGFIERESEAALTSRSYRDNFTYASVNGKPLQNYNGVPIRVQAKVRRRRVADEKHIPFKLVEKHPSWAVKYSWVKPEHKLIAQAILDGKDLEYYNSEKDQHRRVIELAERIEEKLMRRSVNVDPQDCCNHRRHCITTPPTSPIPSVDDIIQILDE